ncbi:MAG: hypothetical protein H8K10_15655 [Nitrospira sp.]|nr:hypothetical protein [Nitrospira sp.]
MRTQKRTKPQRKQQAIPQRASWTPCNSRARLLIVKRGLTYAHIAEQLQQQGIPCSAFNVANVVRGFTKRPDVRQGIANVLGVDVGQLWPERLAS